MNKYRFTSDTFNPKVYYLSYAYYNATNLFPYHLHSFPIITYIADIEGTCIYNIQNETYNIKKGDLIIINPGVYHNKSIKDGSRIEELHLALDEINLLGYPPNYLIHPETHTVINLGSYENRFRYCLDEFYEAHNLEKPLNDIYIKALSLKLFTLAMYCYRKNKVISGDDIQTYNLNSSYKAVTDLRDYLLNNYRDNILLSAVANKMHLSEEYLAHLFKAEIGQSPMSYLIDIRLNKAKSHLTDTNLSISEVAKSVGYNDAYYFSKLFKKHLGISPKDYRKQFKLEKV